MVSFPYTSEGCLLAGRLMIFRVLPKESTTATLSLLHAHASFPSPTGIRRSAPRISFDQIPLHRTFSGLLTGCRGVQAAKSTLISSISVCMALKLERRPFIDKRWCVVWLRVSCELQTREISDTKIVRFSPDRRFG